MRSQLLRSVDAPRPDLAARREAQTPHPSLADSNNPCPRAAARTLGPGISRELQQHGPSSMASGTGGLQGGWVVQGGQFRVGSPLPRTLCGSHHMGLPLSSLSSTNPSHVHPSALSRSQCKGLAHSQGLGLEERGCGQDVVDKNTILCRPGGLGGTPNPPKEAVTGQKGSGPGSSQPW